MKTINIFVVKKDGEIFQADGIQDIYDTVQLHSIEQELKEIYKTNLRSMPYEQEAKDLVGVYAGYNCYIKKIEIEDNLLLKNIND